MGMLKKGGESKNLERKPNPQINNQVDRNSLNVSKIIEKSNPEPQKIGIKSETERATIKVDNHIRNTLTALVNLGKFDSQKNAVEELLNFYIDEMPEEDKKRLDFIVDALELKDYNKQQRKK